MNNGRNGKQTVTNSNPVDSQYLASNSAKANEEHPLTNKGLEILGHSVMSDHLEWYSEPIYPSRVGHILELIEGLEALGRDAESPDLAWRCTELRIDLERAVASAQKLLEATDAAEKGLSLSEEANEKKR